MNVVLVEPQIPPNTGNIARLCAATGTSLHLVGDLGFSIEDKHLKRAGLDYWHLLDIYRHNDFVEFERCCGGRGSFYLFSTKSEHLYTEAEYKEDDYIIFGSETRGLSDDVKQGYSGNCLRIPMIEEARSLNLANAVSIVLYEALRQQQFVSCLPSL